MVPMTLYEPRCKVCTSPNRKTYEEMWAEDPRPTFKELEERAKVLGEDISYKAFERHFSRHFSATVAELVKKEEVVSQAVAEAKKEVIDIVEEIKSNLNGLKALLSATLQASQNQKLSPTILRSLTDLYREHRQSIEACERLTSKLAETTTLSEAELLRILYIFSKDLCPNCLEKFKNNLDEYLRKKGYGSQSFS
jgi:uncharacterized protein with ATP-grasp and redox domains